MAYGVKYTFEWKDGSAAGSGARDARVDIEQLGYSGSTTTLQPAEIPIEITWDEQDQVDLTRPLRISTARLRFIGNTEGELVQEVFDSGDTEWRVRYYVEGNLFWQGYLATDLWRDNPDISWDTVELEAIDGLALLENKEQVLPTSYSGTAQTNTVAQQFATILLGLHDIDLYTTFAWDSDDIFAGSGHCRLDSIYVGDDLYKDVERETGDVEAVLDQRTQLEDLLERFGLTVFQAGGAWHLRQRDQVISDPTNVQRWDWVPSDGEFASAPQLVDLTKTLPVQGVTEFPRSRVSRLRSVKSTHRYDELGELVVNPSFEDGFDDWTVTESGSGAVERVKYDDTILNLNSTQEDTWVVRITGDNQTAGTAQLEHTLQAITHDAGRRAAYKISWDMATDTLLGTVGATQISIGDYYLQPQQLTVQESALPADDGTLFVGAAAGTSMQVPAGARLPVRYAADDTLITTITLSEPVFPGDTRLKGSIEDEVDISQYDAYVTYWYWNDFTFQQELFSRGDYPGLTQTDVLQPQEIFVPLHDQFGTYVSGDLTIRFRREIAERIFIDNVSVQITIDGEPIEETSYIVLDDQFGREVELEHRVGDGPVKQHPRSFRNVSGGLTDDWRPREYILDPPSGKILEQVTAEQAIRQHRGSLDRRFFQYEERGQEVSPEYIYQEGTTYYDVTYLRYVSSTYGNSGSIELTELKDFGLSGLEQAFSMGSGAQASGTTGNTFIGSITQDGIDSAAELAPVLQNEGLGIGTGTVPTEPLRIEDSTGLLLSASREGEDSVLTFGRGGGNEGTLRFTEGSDLFQFEADGGQPLLSTYNRDALTLGVDPNATRSGIELSGDEAEIVLPGGQVTYAPTTDGGPDAANVGLVSDANVYHRAVGEHRFFTGTTTSWADQLSNEKLRLGSEVTAFGNTSVVGDLSVTDEFTAGVAFLGPTETDSLLVTGSTTLQGDTTIQGNLTVLGTRFEADVQTVEISDNLAVINSGETGSGVTAGFSGWRVDRGTAEDYEFGFDEGRDRFVVGKTTKQVVATREDAPIDGGLGFYNSSTNRFETTDQVTWDGSILKVGTGSTRISNDDVDTGSILFDNNEQADFSESGRLFWDASAGLYLRSANAPNATADSPARLLWSGDNFNAAKNLRVTYDFEDRPSLSIIQGSGSGLDADLLDGNHGSFYRNASNLNAGIVPRPRLSGTYDINITGDADTVDGYDAESFFIQGEDTNLKFAPDADQSGFWRMVSRQDGRLQIDHSSAFGTDYLSFDRSRESAYSSVRWDFNEGLDFNIDVRSDGATTGFTGSGTIIAKTESWFDNVQVRGTLFAREFEVSKITVSKGEFAVSPGGGKIESISDSTLFFAEETGIKAGDLLLIKEVTPSDGQIADEIYMRAVSTTDRTKEVSVDLLSGSTRFPEEGDDVVVIGSSDAGRDSMLYLDPYGPHMDVLDGIATRDDWQNRSPLLRLGNINGVPDASGHGLYAENAYLTGSLVVGDLTKSNEYLEYHSGTLTLRGRVDLLDQNGNSVGDAAPLITGIRTDVDDNSASITSQAVAIYDNGEAISTIDQRVTSIEDAETYDKNKYSSSDKANVYNPKPSVVTMDVTDGSSWPGGTYGVLITYWTTDKRARQTYTDTTGATYERLTRPAIYPDWSSWEQVADRAYVDGEVQNVQSAVTTIENTLSTNGITGNSSLTSRVDSVETTAGQALSASNDLEAALTGNDFNTVSALRQRVTSNESGVSSNTSLINTVEQDLEGQIATAESGLQSQIDANKGDIESNVGLINTLQTDTSNLSASLDLLTTTGRQNLIPNNGDEVEWSGGSTFITGRIPIADLDLEPGDDVAGSVELQSASGTQGLFFKAIVRDENSTIIQYPTIVNTTDIGESWTRIEGSISIPEGADTIQFYCANTDQTANARRRRVMVVRGQQPVPYDPNRRAEAAFSLAAQNESGLASVEGRVTDAESTLTSSVQYNDNGAYTELIAGPNGSEITLSADQIDVQGVATFMSARHLVYASDTTLDKAVPQNTTIGNALTIPFAVPSTQGEVVIAIEGYDFEGGWKLGLNGTDLGSMDGPNATMKAYTFTASNLVDQDLNGTRDQVCIQQLQLWRSSGDGGYVKSIRVYYKGQKPPTGEVNLLGSDSHKTITWQKNGGFGHMYKSPVTDISGFRLLDEWGLAPGDLFTFSAEVKVDGGGQSVRLAPIGERADGSRDYSLQRTVIEDTEGEWVRLSLTGLIKSDWEKVAFTLNIENNNALVPMAARHAMLLRGAVTPPYRKDNLLGLGHPSDTTKIDGGKIFTGSVTADKIQVGSITDLDSDAAVKSDIITDYNDLSGLPNLVTDYSDLTGLPTLGSVSELNEISSTYIQDGAIITSKLASGSVTADKLVIQDIAKFTSSIWRETFRDGASGWQTPNGVRGPDQQGRGRIGDDAVTTWSFNDTSASSGGTTDGLYYQIPKEIAEEWSGVRIEIIVWAKKDPNAPNGGNGASDQMAVAYSTADNGNSGWKTFDLTSNWERYTYTWDTPTGKEYANGDYIGILGDANGNGGAALIDYAEVRAHGTNIDGGSIETGSITADQINVNDLFSENITLQSGGLIQSDNYDGTQGFQITADGNADFKEGRFRGEVDLEGGAIFGSITMAETGSVRIGGTTDAFYLGDFDFSAGSDSDTLFGSKIEVSATTVTTSSVTDEDSATYDPGQSIGGWAVSVEVSTFIRSYPSAGTNAKWTLIAEALDSSYDVIDTFLISGTESETRTLDFVAPSGTRRIRIRRQVLAWKQISEIPVTPIARINSGVDVSASSQTDFVGPRGAVWRDGSTEKVRIDAPAGEVSAGVVTADTVRADSGAQAIELLSNFSGGVGLRFEGPHYSKIASYEVSTGEAVLYIHQANSNDWNLRLAYRRPSGNFKDVYVAG